MIELKNWNIFKMDYNHSTEHIPDSFKEVLLWASSFLKKAGNEPFAAEWLMREQFDLTKTELIINFLKPMQADDKEQYIKNIYAHVEGTPVQQIVGHEWFYGRKFIVSTDTLIPRPETEELVELMLKEAEDEPLSVLDIGTGTGAIACTIKAERPQDTVTAVDISPEALETARKNGVALGTKITWLEGDLTKSVSGQVFDVIISNPPYIGEDEVGTLEEGVRKTEPSLALFAGKDGLDIFRRLADELPTIMHENSKVYLEMGFQQGDALKNILSKAFPYRSVKVIKDISGKDRMVRMGEEESYPQ